jgi:hypothetical protein
MFRAKRKEVKFQEAMKIGEAWSLHPVIDETHRYMGFIHVQERRVCVEIDFPSDFPFAEPRFKFPKADVTNPCVDSKTGQMDPLWGPAWSPAASHPNVIMQSLIAALNAHDIKGKAPERKALPGKLTVVPSPARKAGSSKSI